VPDSPISDAWPADAITASPSCGAFPGPKMVRIDASKPYCIDTTEVTNEQYNVFLASSAKPSLPSWCVKTKMTPDAQPVLDVTRRNHPRVDVDWCEAFLYCAWAGKRLCGAIAGGRTSYFDWIQTDASQWSWVCGNGAANTPYPYGSAEKPDDQGCVTQSTNVVAVGAAKSCHGTSAPYDQVFDMVGNAAEWEDACSAYEGTTPDGRTCKTRGGWTPLMGATCDYDQESSADFKAGDLSFRCCRDL
jgi:formylglycine-generating enzyme